MSELKYERFISHDGVSIAYRVSGDGKPVVLVHGYTVTSTVNFATGSAPTEAGFGPSAPSPTIESTLLEAGYQVVMLDLRGHGHSDKPHDRNSYTMEAHVGDVQALIEHLSLGRPAVVGYSLGAMVTGRLLGAPWVSAAALCGIGTFAVYGQDDELLEGISICAKCFIEGCWDDHPDVKGYRTFAELDPEADFAAIGAAGLGIRGMPSDILKASRMPVLVLNGGADEGALDEYDLTPFIPGARRAVAGDGDHGTAPSDPRFQQELVRFLQEVY